MKRALQSKNQAYLNVLQSMDGKVSSSRKKGEITTLLCKQILSFNRKTLGEGYNFGINTLKALELQEVVFDMFVKAIYSEEKEYSEEELISELLKEIQAQTIVTRFENKIENFNKVNINYKVIEAIIKVYLLIFSDEISSSGLYIIAGKNSNDRIALSLISPYAYSMDAKILDNHNIVLNNKVEFIKGLFNNIEKVYNTSCMLTYSNMSIILVVTLENLREGLNPIDSDNIKV